MRELLIISVAGIGMLALTRTQLAAALAQGEELNLPCTAKGSHSTADELVDAKTLEHRTGVPAAWWTMQARQERIPFLSIGRRVPSIRG